LGGLVSTPPSPIPTEEVLVDESPSSSSTATSPRRRPPPVYEGCGHGSGTLCSYRFTYSCSSCFSARIMWFSMLRRAGGQGWQHFSPPRHCCGLASLFTSRYCCASKHDIQSMTASSTVQSTTAGNTVQLMTAGDTVHSMTSHEHSSIDDSRHTVQSLTAGTIHPRNQSDTPGSECNP
jgi:hypothetical protein